MFLYAKDWGDIWEKIPSKNTETASILMEDTVLNSHRRYCATNSTV